MKFINIKTKEIFSVKDELSIRNFLNKLDFDVYEEKKETEEKKPRRTRKKTEEKE